MPKMKPLTKSRTVNNFYLLAIIAVAFFAFKYSARFLAIVGDVGQVADLGVDILQPIFVTIIYICCGLVFSTLMAAFVEPQLREDSFGGWSRFGIVFLCCFFGYCSLAAAVL